MKWLIAHLLNYFSSRKISINERMSDCDYICRGLLRNGVNKKLLSSAYCVECRLNGEEFLTYSQFCYYIQKDEEKMQSEVGWAGDTAQLIDSDTDEITNAWIFVGVLTYSQYAFVKAYLDKKTDNWITAVLRNDQFFTCRIKCWDSWKFEYLQCKKVLKERMKQAQFISWGRKAFTDTVSATLFELAEYK